jgi:hypothetical protein
MQIYEHKVDNVIMMDPPGLRIPYLVTLNLSPTQQPYPTPWGHALRHDARALDLRTPPGTA